MEVMELILIRTSDCSHLGSSPTAEPSGGLPVPAPDSTSTGTAAGSATSGRVPTASCKDPEV